VAAPRAQYRIACCGHQYQSTGLAKDLFMGLAMFMGLAIKYHSAA